MVRENRGLLALAVLMLALAGFLGAPSDSGRVLDPNSTGDIGFAAGVRLLESLGADVQVGSEPGDVGDLVIVTRSTLDDAQQDALRAHVRDGGRALVFDPDLPFVAVDVIDRLVTSVYGPTLAIGTCDRLDGYVDEVSSSDWLVLGEAPDGENCLPVGAGVGLRVLAVGDGQVVLMGARSPFTNQSIGLADHARLLAFIAFPDQVGDVVVLDERTPGTAEEAQGVLDLVSPRFWAPAGLLVAALVLLGWSRARRLGRPVHEDLVVEIPGSELAIAIGDLLHRHGHRDAAAQRLRDDLRRDVAGLLELPRDTDAATVATVVRQRAPHVGEGDILLALTSQSVPDDEVLTRVGAAVARVRRAFDHDQ